MNKAIKILSLAILIGGFIFAGYKLFFQGEKQEGPEVVKAETSNSQAAKKKEAPLPVKVIEVEKGQLPLRLRLAATADVWEKTMIRSDVRSKVEKIYCSVGDLVKEGELLVKLDDTEIKLEVDRARTAKLKALSNFLVKESMEIETGEEVTAEQKAELAKAKERYLKAVDDFAKGKISEAEFDRIDEEYETSQVFSGVLREQIRKAQEGLSEAIILLKQKELDLKRTSIRAPFKGIIADLKASTGEKINVGDEILKIVNLDSLYLKGYALESEISNLKIGTRVRVKLDSYSDQYFYGELQAISPEVDPTTKTITVFIKIDNHQNKILPGMHAEIDVEYKVFENVIKVPRDAVIVRQERPLVFRVDENTALWTYVEVGPKNDEEWQIISGLKEGDLVVVEGQLTLAHQSKVRIIQ